MNLYMVAILPPAAIDEQVYEWKQYMLQVYGCKNALKSPAHITLVPPFKLDVLQQVPLHEALQDFTASRSGFRIDINHFGSFPPRVIYAAIAENESLQKLQPELQDYLLDNNYPIKKENRSFHPHITIANRDLGKNDFGSAWQYFEEKKFQGSFTASSVALLRHNGRIWEPFFDAPFGEQPNVKN